MRNSIKLSIFILFLVAGSVMNSIAVAQLSNSAALSDLVELLADDKPNSVVRGEAIQAALSKGGSPNVTGAYVLALLYVREKKLDRAVECLVALPNEAEKSLPILRLRLWIELERGKLDVAERILPVLQAQVQNVELNEKDKAYTMRMLGGVAALFPEAEARFDVRVVEAAVKATGKKEDLKLAQEYREAEKHIAEQRTIVADLVGAGTAHPMGIGDKLNEAQANWRASEFELKKTREMSSLTAKESRVATQQLPVQKVVTERNIAWLQNSNEAPNKPSRPSRPREPSKPRRSEFDKDEEFRKAEDKYQDDKRDFDRALDKYKEEERTYERRMAAWEVENRKWPMTKIRLIDEARQRLTDLITNEKELREKVPKLRDRIPKLTQELRETEFRVQVLKRLSMTEPVADPQQLLVRPSSYDLLSFPQEQQRLKQIIRPATKN